MSERPETLREAARLDAVYRAKARAEVAAAEALVPGGVVRGQGNVLAEVLLVKGEPGPGDLAAGRALAGEDGAAIGKALDALALPKERFAFCTRVGETGSPERIRRVRQLVEAIDPRVVVLLDAGAAEDFGAAYGQPAPTVGVVASVLGRAVLALDGFEASLADEPRKRRVWRQLRALDRTDAQG